MGAVEHGSAPDEFRDPDHRFANRLNVFPQRFTGKFPTQCNREISAADQGIFRTQQGFHCRNGIEIQRQLIGNCEANYPIRRIPCIFP
jgi:hypothetical protein